MIADELRKIFEAEEQERSFYVHRLKPALDRLEHSENVLSERLNIEKLVNGTSFERAFKLLEASDNHNLDASQRLYKLNHICQDIMRSSHANRQQEMKQILQKTSASDLTPDGLYYLAHVYSQGHTEQDTQQADDFLNQALQMQPEPQNEVLLQKLKELLAHNYDRWQLKKTPPQPQKYGTVYADHHDVAKGMEKNHLIRPTLGYQYQRQELDRARKALGIGALADQEKALGITPTLPMYEMSCSFDKENLDSI
ncbi:MAG: hypothetical protein CK424_05325 [Legionella sp.]|nr:MAG: hypothetical protein CK424_05325 [Legionella sp.]